MNLWWTWWTLMNLSPRLSPDQEVHPLCFSYPHLINVIHSLFFIICYIVSFFVFHGFQYPFPLVKWSRFPHIVLQITLKKILLCLIIADACIQDLSSIISKAKSLKDKEYIKQLQHMWFEHRLQKLGHIYADNAYSSLASICRPCTLISILTFVSCVRGLLWTCVQERPLWGVVLLLRISAYKNARALIIIDISKSPDEWYLYPVMLYFLLIMSYKR